MSAPRKLSDGPVIIVNGVAYRSPEDMPAGDRDIWDRHARQMEQQGIDWRELTRIVLRHGREGNVVRQSINIERRTGNIDGWPGHTGIEMPPLRKWARQREAPRHTPFEWAQGAFVMGWVALFIYGLVSNFGFYTDVLVRASHSVLLYLAYVVFLLPFLLMATASVYFRRRPRDSESRMERFLRRFDGLSSSQMGEGSAWNGAIFSLALFAMPFFISYVTTFGGAAKLLHYAVRTPGEITATISGKSTRRGKFERCAPTLELQEFRFIGDEMCVDAGLFSVVQVGDRIRITGKISPYGVEPYRVDVASDPPALPKDIE